VIPLDTTVSDPKGVFMRPLNISASQAKDYYYQKDPCFNAPTNSRWHGELAKEMGLSLFTVQPGIFQNIIAGNNLKGKQVVKDGINTDGVSEHRAAVDIPLSAPKSVSILALHCGDRKLIKARETAVEKSIEYLEKNYIYARQTNNHRTRAFKTGKGLFATFNHSTSRANDPQLHTHTLIMNMTQTAKGFRAVYNDEIFRDQQLINYV
jgi:conjugative relaxase-like TrwC/TraI family protein